MPPVKKPKPNQIKRPATPIKKDQKIAVISGQLKKRLPKAKNEVKRPERGVVLVKHLPHGFFEQQLRQYFRQFGNVTRLRLARSERTGGSKGFAFVEFEYPEVAKVAADTMDNYLMFQKVVKATYIPPEKQNFNYFKTSVKRVKNKAGKDIYVSSVTKATQKSVKKLNNWNETTCQKRTVAGMRKLKDLQKKYKHLGIDFNTLLVEPQQKSKEDKPTTAKKSKKQKKELELEDLLGNTINEDSEDEDYVDDEDEDEDADQTLLSVESAEEDESEDDDDDDEEEEEEEEVASPPPKKSQKKKKNTAEERLSDLLKRKPGSGGVQKKKASAPAAKVNKKAVKEPLKLAAAKQLAKPLQKMGKKLKKK
ncbi:MKI67 FHA domain-interacting nucleolar phosphoprotein [Drosophila albomicans]|uniref:MKI67 FHA domain-interacting nucleolar phosphoprotein n=1 Tax=Drosophila albomicans TaxID=7291 RepID=A0A6P8Z7I7_DROAB|nr:MKI67 FHA domain-interacting nucleolar phosphoprotein [Drosophila albomicans]